MAVRVFDHDNQETKKSLSLYGPATFQEVQTLKDVSVHDYERPVGIDAAESGLGKAISDFFRSHEQAVKDLTSKGAIELDSSAERKKDKEPGTHCFRSFSLATPWAWDLDGIVFPGTQCKRGFVRVQAVERLSMQPTAWPLHGAGGLIVGFEGTVNVLILEKGVVSGHQDVHSFLKLLGDNDHVLETQSTAILTSGTGVWVPFGHVAITVGLSPHRSTLVDNLDKRGRPKTAGNTGDRQFCSTVFLPCLSTTDPDDEIEVVRSVNARLAVSSQYLPASFRNDGGFDVWKSCLDAKAESTLKTVVEDAENIQGNG